MSTHPKSSIGTSKHDCFVMFDISFADIGYEISNKTYSGWDVEFKYSDMGYPQIIVPLCGISALPPCHRK